MSATYAFIATSIILMLGFSVPCILQCETTTASSQSQIEVPALFHVITDIWITAYSSTPEETDDTPFITASGERVRDGIIAANFLPFGTKVRIPELFGEREFIVKDRMHRRKTNFVDIWMPSKELAQEFGIHQTAIEVIKNPERFVLTALYDASYAQNRP